MKQIARIIVVAAAVNYLILVASIELLHDHRDLYNSFNIGDTLTLEASQRLHIQDACWPTSPDKTSSVCKFSDFWQHYTITFDKGVVTSKYRTPIADILHPSMFVSRLHRKWIAIFVLFFLVGAIGATILYIFRGRAQPTIS